MTLSSCVTMCDHIYVCCAYIWLLYPNQSIKLPQVVTMYRYFSDPINCNCDLYWLLEWSLANSERQLIGTCKEPSGLSLSELNVKDLYCQGAVFHTLLAHYVLCSYG